MPFTDTIKFAEVVMAEKGTITALPEDVVAGKIYIGANLNYETGSLPLLDSQGSITLLAGESHEIPYGKNPYAFLIKAETLEAQTPGDVEDKYIAKNKIAWVNGEKVVGTMESIDPTETSILAGEEYEIPEGYHNGLGKVVGRPLSEQTPGTAMAKEIIAGKIAWVNGTEITGTMPDNGSGTMELSAGDKYPIPEGYYNGTGYVRAKSLAEETVATADRTELLDGKTAWVNGFKITGTMPKIPKNDIILPLNGEYFIPHGCHTGNGRVTQNIPYKEGQTIAPGKNQQTIEVAGHYMTGNIIISGVDALTYQRTNATMKDSTGEFISNYELTVASNKAQVKLYLDNWHNNSTLNNYHLLFTDLKDVDGNDISLECYIEFDWVSPADKTITFGGVSITIGLDSVDKDVQLLQINGITSGKLTMKEKFSARQFGNE